MKHLCKATQMSNAAISARKDEAILRGIGTQTQIYADHAKNSEVWDVEGNRYIDFATGIAVLTPGSSTQAGFHPETHV